MPDVVPAAPTNTVSTSALPVASGITAGDGTYTRGTQVTVSAAAEAGYVFVNWIDTATGNQVSASPTYIFTLNTNVALQANFAAAPQYEVGLAAAPAAGGSVAGDGIFDAGANVTVIATESSSYYFQNWTDAVTDEIVSTSPSYTFALTADTNLVANFAPVGAVNCGSCMYSFIPPKDAPQAGARVCARHAPSVVPQVGTMFAAQPVVTVDYWCGEWAKQ
jgi:Divergent InlB B-repeat domain